MNLYWQGFTNGWLVGWVCGAVACLAVFWIFNWYVSRPISSRESRRYGR